MLYKYVYALLTVLAFTGCAGDGGSSNPTPTPSPVIGYDYSGTYIGGRVECYNSAMTAVTTYADISGGLSTIVINKNNQATTAVDGACTVQLSGSIEFMPDGVLNLRSRTVTSATGGACTVTTTLAATPANTVSPTTRSTPYTNGQVFNAVVGTYIRNATTGAIAIFSTYTNSANSADLCYTILLKQ